MKTCKTCRFWEDGCCDFVDTIPAEKPDTLFQIEAWADDDSNLGAKLRTGPNFGCIHHSAKVDTSFDDFRHEGGEAGQ